MSNGAAPPAKACRCASVPKNITAHSTPLPARSPATSVPVGNRAARACRLSGERNRFVQHVEVADVVGENEHELGVESGGFGVRQIPPRIDGRDTT